MILLDEFFVVVGVAAADDEEAVRGVEPAELLVPALGRPGRNGLHREPVRRFVLGLVVIGFVLAVVGLPLLAPLFDRFEVLAGVLDGRERALLFLLDAFCLGVEAVCVLLDAHRQRRG